MKNTEFPKVTSLIIFLNDNTVYSVDMIYADYFVGDYILVKSLSEHLAHYGQTLSDMRRSTT